MTPFSRSGLIHTTLLADELYGAMLRGFRAAKEDFFMRLLVDTLIALMLAAILAGVIWHYRGQRRQTHHLAQVQTALLRLHGQMIYHKALGDVKLSETGYPLRINPKWFGRQLPRNRLVSAGHPWINAARPGDAAINPADPVLTQQHQATFWYNPNNGEIRARVPRRLSDEATLTLYNRVNNAEMTSLPDEDQAETSVKVADQDRGKIPEQTGVAEARTPEHVRNDPPAPRPTLVLSR